MRKAARPTIVRLRLRGASRDVNGNLCAEAIETRSGRRVAVAGQCQWEGQIIIEKGMEGLFDFQEKKKGRSK